MPNFMQLFNLATAVDPIVRTNRKNRIIKRILFEAWRSLAYEKTYQDKQEEYRLNIENTLSTEDFGYSSKQTPVETLLKKLGPMPIAKSSTIAESKSDEEPKINLEKFLVAILLHDRKYLYGNHLDKKYFNPIIDALPTLIERLPTTDAQDRVLEIYAKQHGTVKIKEPCREEYERIEDTLRADIKTFFLPIPKGIERLDFKMAANSLRYILYRATRTSRIRNFNKSMLPKAVVAFLDYCKTGMEQTRLIKKFRHAKRNCAQHAKTRLAKPMPQRNPNLLPNTKINRPHPC